MTSITSVSPSDFGDSPIERPLTYPGKLPSTSGLLLADRFVAMHPERGRRLQQWRVELPVVEVLSERTLERPHLSYVLLRQNQTQVGQRIPVLAVGSNAAPAQLWRKFRNQGVDPVVPMVLAKVGNLTVGWSGHVSGPGYVAAVPVATPGATSCLFVLWVDRKQLELLDATEPNYHRIRLDGQDFPIELPSGDTLPYVYTYFGRWGHLLAEDGRPLRAPDAGSKPVEGALTEPELIAWLAARDLLPTGAVTPEEWVAAAGADAQLRSTARALWESRGHIGRDAILDGLVRAAGGSEEFLARVPAASYDAMLSPPPPGSDALRVTKTADDTDRRGEAVIRVSPRVRQRISGSHVIATFAGGPAAALARLDRHESVPDGLAEVDQVVRNAVGVEVGELVDVHPVSVRRMTMLDWLVGRPTYVTCRVQPGDLTIVEREVCLLDGLTLSLLGSVSGDEVVIEGIAPPGRTVPQVRIKAYEVSDSVQRRRELLHGGDADRRFPSALDALGVYPDLPWIFLDSSVRSALGIPPHLRLATVRVRCSRRYQLTKELREILLLLVLAFVGVVTVVENRSVQVALLALVSAMAAVIVVIRARSRLSQRLHRARNGAQVQTVAPRPRRG